MRASIVRIFLYIKIQKMFGHFIIYYTIQTDITGLECTSERSVPPFPPSPPPPESKEQV
jgi:hypothetical protein